MTQLLTLAGTQLLAILLSLGLIALLAWVAIRLLYVARRRLTARVEKTETDPGRKARLKTVLDTATHTLIFIILAAAVLMALNAVGINIGPLLAGVGVAGLALSLGAQTLIKDFIGGLLILIEDQFRTGDVIQVGSTIGTVEQITLRVTYVRDFPGQLWAIPNGDVRVVANQSRSWARAIVDLNVPFDTDMSQVIVELEAAAARTAEDEAVKTYLLEAPQVLGWNAFSDWAMQVRLVARTVPGKQADVARILRQHALVALRQSGIRVALPAQEWRSAAPPSNASTASTASTPPAAGAASETPPPRRYK
jgi:moderate conductance mechanosensitive channel